MGEKRLKISDTSRDTGINRGTLTRLYNETATRVDLEVLNNYVIISIFLSGNYLKYKRRQWISLYNS
ncbi:helix-turn-helix domain-containing protein [Photobacterium kishitanii]|uniref:helix-turn-helix domain-containing protein n=1 Tax=Photobacterium kishitanii TaxID=318456 RepID=UPI001F3659D8|nr:helix-turn-helix transcriptional regulator [Photobacterium kishitanii]